MRFSIWPGPIDPWEEILDLTRHCEAAGWDGVYFADHFMPNTDDGRPADGPMVECWAVLAGLAAAVPRLRIGPLVCGNTYRHPAVLANIAAAVDNISGGRLVLGLGAGWQVNEHEAYGIPLFGVKERLDRLEEACQVVTGLLRERRTTFAGRYYRVTDAPNQPAPVQERLPLLIWGGGERRTMRIAARYADEWNVWSTPDRLRQKREVLLRHCDDLGRDPSEIAVSTNAALFMYDDRAELDRQRAEDGARAEMIGTPAELVDLVAEYQAVGADELIIPDVGMGPLERRKDTYDRFLTEVAASFR
jgi:F420-dependent oxidoreductase-like protein